jgi:hypothetical protein
VYAIYNRFDFGTHVASMRERHRDWSEAQVRCCLYWQGRARQQLRAEIDRFAVEHPGYVVETTPEAMCVDVTATMAAVGIHLEWPPQGYTYQVALAWRALGGETAGMRVEETQCALAI